MDEEGVSRHPAGPHCVCVDVGLPVRATQWLIALALTVRAHSFLPQQLAM
jgi:hypothetical protein